MDSVASLDEQALREQLAKARATLDGLARSVRAIDAELEDLSGERQQHRLLDEVCGALEQLGELGGSRLFWGEQAADGEVADHIRRVRCRIDAFQKRVGEIVGRREALIDEIDQQEQSAWFIEDEILEAQEQEERRRQEWVIEREVDVFPVRELVMPWTRDAEEDRRYRKSLRISLLLSLLFAILVPRVHLPLPEPTQGPPDVPERLTRLIMQRRQLPPPPPTPKEVVAEPKPSDETVAEAAPTQPAKVKEGPGKGPSEGPGVGPGKGILAFREKLAAVAENQAIARLGAQARISSPGATPSGLVERSMVATLAPGSSGGINLAEFSRGVVGAGGGGAGKLGGVQIARATSTIAGGGGGRGLAGTSAGNGATLGRTDEEIQIVFDRHKAALYRLYNRELRVDPTLKGQMILRLRIEPDGSVSLCELHGSDMRAPQLAAQVVERVKTFDFGAKEGIPAITILYPIDFLPAT